MTKRALRFLATVAMSLSGLIAPGSAQAAKIYVSTTAPDPVGRRVSYELREKIASSSRHTLVIDENDAAFKIAIVTMDSESNQVSTIYSVVLTLRDFSQEASLDYFITSWVGVCGRDRVVSCAGDLASQIDAEIEPLVQMMLKKIKEMEGSGGKRKLTS